MEIRKTTIKNVGIITAVTILCITGFVALFNGRDNGPQGSDAVTNTDGKQILTLTAKGGYSPSIIEAKANQDMVLRVSTSNTFDCSSALSIPRLGIRKNLPVTGKTDIVIKAQEAGSEIDGTCSMGMYRFKIRII